MAPVFASFLFIHSIHTPVPLETFRRVVDGGPGPWAVRARVAGRDAWLALEPRSPLTVVSREWLAGATPGKVEVGGTLLEGARAAMWEPEDWGGGRTVVGVLGRDLFERAVVGFDPEAGAVVLLPSGADPSAWVGEGAARIGIERGKEGGPVERWPVAGRVMTFGLDVSGSVALARRSALPPEARRFGWLRHDGSSRRAWALTPVAAPGRPACLLALGEAEEAELGPGEDGRVPVGRGLAGRYALDLAGGGLYGRPATADEILARDLSECVAHFDLRLDGDRVRVAPLAPRRPREVRDQIGPYVGNEVLGIAGLKAGPLVAALREGDREALEMLSEVLGSQYLIVIEETPGGRGKFGFPVSPLDE